jgi:N-acetyl-anhydromuramyl-L-alanine amidase AmpD
MSADYPDAISYLVDESRVFINQNSHSAIVIHGTGGSATQTAQELGDYFRTNAGEVSSHFGIDRAGVVAQFVPLQDGAAANCCVSAGHDVFWDQFHGDNLNRHTLSVEHENDAQNSLPLTPAQQQASFKLIAFLCQKYNIAPSHIKSHASIDPVNRSRCPGAYPWQALYTYLGASTVATLEGFPMISQLDHDINAQFDCVPTSIAAAMQYLTGTAFSGSEVKDAVYGAGYQGVTAPGEYIGYCAKHGVLLSPFNGTNVALVAATREQIGHGNPVLLTQIDPYMPIGSGVSHVVAAYACNTNSITVMDPYIDQPVTKSDQQWESDLLSGQIWIVEKETSMIPTGWVDNGTTLTAPNKCVVTLGFRDYVLSHSWDANNWPLENAHAQMPLELSDPSLGNGTQQVCRSTVLEWTPGTGVFVAWSGQELLKMRALLASQSEPTTPVVDINRQQAISTLQTIDVAIKAVLHDLGVS